MLLHPGQPGKEESFVSGHPVKIWLSFARILRAASVPACALPSLDDAVMLSVERSDTQFLL